MTDKLQAATSGPAVPEGGLSGWIAGRGNRRSYWLFVGPSIVANEVVAAMGFPAVRWVVMLPTLFAEIRRFHDLGRTGWMAPLLSIATNIVGFGILKFTPADIGAGLQALLHYGVLLAIGLIPGQRRRNPFGSPPGLRQANLEHTFS